MQVQVQVQRLIFIPICGVQECVFLVLLQMAIFGNIFNLLTYKKNVSDSKSCTIANWQLYTLILCHISFGFKITILVPKLWRCKMLNLKMVQFAWCRNCITKGLLSTLLTRQFFYMVCIGSIPNIISLKALNMF